MNQKHNKPFILLHSMFFLLFNLNYTKAITQINPRTTSIQSKLYGQSEGLKGYNVRKIIQDKFGFFWIATIEGLSRFDGNNFIYLSSSLDGQKRLSSPDIRDFWEDTSKNNLWVLGAEQAIDVVDLVTCTVNQKIVIPNKTTTEWNRCIIEVEEEMWVGSNNGIYCANKKGEFANIHLLEGENIDFLYLDNQKRVWAGIENKGIKIINIVSKKDISYWRYNIGNTDAKTQIVYNNCISLQNDKVAISSNQGLLLFSCKLNNKKIENLNTHYPEINALGNSVNCITKVKNSIYYISTSSGLSRWSINEKRVDIVNDGSNSEADSWLPFVNNIFIDKHDNIILGCKQGFCFSKTAFPSFKKFISNIDKTIQLNHVRSILAEKDNSFLVGLNNTLVKINELTNKYEKIDSGCIYHHIFNDYKGEKNVGTSNGWFFINNNKLSYIDTKYPELKSFKKNIINSHLYTDSLIILGTEDEHGIILWDTQKRTARNINISSSPANLSSNTVNNIFKDNQHNLWVLSDNTVTIINKELSQSKKLKILNDNGNYHLFFDMCQVGNRYYLASYGEGILILDGNFSLIDIINEKTGLSNNGVYQIFNYQDKDLFITSNNGLNRISLPSLQIQRFYEKDGLHGNAFEEVAGSVDSLLIFAGGIDGFTRINPSLIRKNLMPPFLYWSNIQLQRETTKTDSINILIEEFQIPYNTLQTTISFAALNYSNPTRTTYAYQIKELHKSFLPLGTQNFINLIGLSPGTYTLQVKAANEDGVWCEPKTLTLIFEPKWYQTLLFKILLVITGIGIGYGMYRYRLHQLKREESIRTRIAADLHDDIGSTLTSVRIFTDLGMAKNTTEYFPQIRLGIQEASTSLRDIIWVLDKTNNNAKQLLERIAKFALPLTVARQIDFRLQEEDALEHIELGTELRRDLYLIVKEFITNSLKYSQCQHITLHAKKQNKKLYILLQDDGVGFDPSTIIRGNGLNNMVKRASGAGYKAIVTSQPNQGSSLELVPL